MEEKNGKKLGRKAKQEQSAGNNNAGKPKKRVGLRILGVLGTLMLVGVLTAAMFVGIFMYYVETALKGHVEVDLSEYTQEVSTELYYKDPATGEWFMYQTLFANENRIWVDSEEIPDYMKKATIAIEDKRFEEHEGVDWKGTLRGVAYTVTGHDVQGGSTITQQLIKNITGDKQNTVKRKVVEIYRALALEQEGYSKDEILTIYLNTIYLGNQCYGVQTAADMYFNKDATELSLAECATLIGITNNPSMYDPLRADWCREKNRERQQLILAQMLEQGMIDQATHDAAVAEEVVFTNGWTNQGNYVGKTSDSNTNKVVSTANNSYYTDAVIDDVASALVEYYGLTDDEPDANGWVRTAHAKAVSMVYGKGLKIYTCQNPKYQEIAETVFENTSFTKYKDKYGQPLQAAITVMDPYTGDIVALVGGTGAKEYDRSWNWATEVRQCGSAIKPISTYAPALDNGTITAGSSIEDYPIYLRGYGVYPRNSYGNFVGRQTVQEAVRRSSNAAAVNLNRLYGTAASYNFMTEKLGFTTLTRTDSEQVGNMALGGLQYGVTTEEMAAAFSAFVNDGIYTKPRTFERVELNDGTVLIDNASESHVAMKATTAYQMRQLLLEVVSRGTGTSADFSGQPVAGKTGTTDANRDRYFVGFTPYYCAAVWSGYKSNATINISTNPSASLWRSVMKEIHADLSRKSFNKCSGLTTISVCSDSGLLATDACTHDLRGSRARSVTVAAEFAPKESCNMHTMVQYCEEGKHIATEFCPAETVKEVAVLDFARELVTKNGSAIKEDDTVQASVVKAKDHEYLLQTISLGELCPAHQEAPILPPVLPEDPDLPDLPDLPGEGGEGGGNQGGEGGGQTGEGGGQTGEGNQGGNQSGEGTGTDAGTGANLAGFHWPW